MNTSGMCAVLIFILLQVFHLTEGMCMRWHPQKHFCQSHFVIKATVIYEKENCSTKGFSYILNVKRVFKGNENILNDKANIELHTPSTNNGNAIKLDISEKYLLTGFMSDNGKLQANQCNFIHKWSELTATQRHGFRKYYKTSCDCQISVNHSWECYEKYAFYKKKEGKCTWNTKSDQFENCIKISMNSLS